MAQAEADAAAPKISDWKKIRALYFAQCWANEVRQKQLEQLYDDDWFTCSLSIASEKEGPQWALEQTALLGVEGDERRFQDQAALLRRDCFASVTEAVARLNSAEGRIACPEGICVVFSAKKRQYFLLYRNDKKTAAFEMFNLYD
eukprot:TRINITY_DN55628_c0_g1_i1.p2 TRINITY_DN55628_c0_g1~~TRINITY_DN55628_c0_g1_i1.p2  ORF type:complete len:145 (-),score=38.79 TRINITY_DN55628_c0_g1_i1:34-468(-)